jgi:hypothetical protein
MNTGPAELFLFQFIDLFQVKKRIKQNVTLEWNADKMHNLKNNVNYTSVFL